MSASEVRAAVEAAFRDYETAGVPASGAHEPVKAEIRDALGRLLESTLASIGTGIFRYATKAAMDADDSRPAGSLAYVYANNADPGDALNGYYQYDGADWDVAEWLNGYFAPQVADLERAYTHANLWADPFFDVVRATNATVGGKPAMLHAAGEWVPGNDTGLAKNPLSEGAWKCTGGLLSWRLWFDIPGIASMAIAEGDTISLGAILNAPNGVNVRFYARFMTAASVNVGDQHESANYVSDGTPSTLTIDGLAVPATAAQLLVYLDGAGGDKYLQALWGVLADEAGPYPIARSIVEDSEGASAALAVANLWADPFFKTVRSAAGVIGNQAVVSPLYAAGQWVSAGTDPNAFNPYGGGAWRINAGGGIFGLNFDFSNPSLAAFDIEAGDVISVGTLVKAAAGSTVGTYLRFKDATGALFGPQYGANNAGDGQYHASTINNVEVPVGAVGALLYFDAGAQPSYLAGLWVVPAATAGIMPPDDVFTVPLSNTTGTSAVTPDPNALALAPRLFAIAGVEANVYPENMRAGRGPVVHNLNVAGNRGKTLRERWTWTPVNGDAGDYAFYARVLDPDTLIPLGAAQSLLSVLAQGAAAGEAVKLLSIGDSNTASGYRLKRIVDLSAARPTDAQVQTVGTQTTVFGATTVRHEGRGGWSVVRYYAPEGADVAANPFVAGAGQKFNAAHWVANSGQPVPNVITWPLGVNDMFSSPSDADLAARIATFISQLKQMIGLEAAADVTSWKEVNNAIAHFVPLPLLPLDQDGFSVVTGSGQYQARYWRNIVGLSLALIDEFSGLEAEKVFLLPHNVSHDVYHNMPKLAAAPWNAHTAVTVQRDSNDVHPADAGGNEQLGDCEFAAINWLVATGVI